MKKQTYRRRRVLIQPRLQLRLVIAFMSAACISAVIQTLLLSYRLSAMAETLPSEGALVMERLPVVLRDQVLLTLGLMVPLMLAVGILETFRIAGPLHRCETYLREIAAGSRPDPCRIRKEDELQDFCRLLNDATQPLLRGDEAAAANGPGSEADEVPSLAEKRSAASSTEAA